MKAENLAHSISTAELERRWAAVRAAMAERDIDALIMQNSNSFHGGYVKWFTDVPAMNGGYQAVVFLRDDRMIAVRHGPLRKADVAEDDPVDRGVGRLLTAPTFAAADFTKHYHSDLVLEELKDRNLRTVGLVGTNSMAYPFLEAIREGLSNVRFDDATELVDEIKAVKSAEEMALIRKTAEMQDAAMEAAINAIEPGKKGFEITAVAQYVGQTMGSTQGLFMAGSGPAGTAAPIQLRPMQGRKVQKGDQINILVENSGDGGFYTEIGRSVVLGKASSELLEEFAFALEAQRYTLSLIKPGADPREIYARYNDFMRSHGKPEERRLHAHSQGYDLVERPLILPDETMKIKADMNFVVHPTYGTGTVFSWICDNFAVTAAGAGERLHKLPQKIFEV